MTGIYFEQHGPADGEVLLLSSGLGGSGAHWGDNLAALSRDYRVVLYDQRGTGRSPAVLPDPTSIASMADDAAWVLDQVGARSCRFIGHALGGLIGLALAASRPDRVRDLVIVNGWGEPDPHTRRCFDMRREWLRTAGTESYVRTQKLFLYPSRWMTTHAGRLAREEAHALAHFPGTDNVLRRIAALLAFNGSALLAGLTCRTLLIVSEDDLLVPPQRSEMLHAALPGSQLRRLDGGHACNVTRPAEFEAMCLAFLACEAPAHTG